MENGKTKEGEVTGEAKQSRSDRLVQIYKRLEQIDAYSAESRAGSILAVSSLYLPWCKQKSLILSSCKNYF